MTLLPIPEHLEAERSINAMRAMAQANLKIAALCDNMLAGRDPFDGLDAEWK